MPGTNDTKKTNTQKQSEKTRHNERKKKTKQKMLKIQLNPVGIAVTEARRVETDDYTQYTTVTMISRLVSNLSLKLL